MVRDFWLILEREWVDIFILWRICSFDTRNDLLMFNQELLPKDLSVLFPSNNLIIEIQFFYKKFR